MPALTCAATAPESLLQKEEEEGEGLGDAARRKAHQAKGRTGKALDEAADSAQRGWFGVKVGGAPRQWRCWLRCAVAGLAVGSGSGKWCFSACSYGLLLGTGQGPS